MLALLLCFLPDSQDFSQTPVDSPPLLILFVSPHEMISDQARAMVRLPCMKPYRVRIVEDWRERDRAGVKQTPEWRLYRQDGTVKGKCVDPGVLEIRAFLKP